MEKIRRQVMLCNFFIFLVTLLFDVATFVEADIEEEFDYSFKSGKGPAQWGEIHPEWSLCKNGKMQSPVDISNAEVKVESGESLTMRYKVSNAVIKTRGHNIVLKWEGDAGHMILKGTNYQLEQIHWHSPSEHTINGKRFDLEGHLLHKSPDGKNAVVSILYEIGAPNPFLSLIMNHLSGIKNFYFKDENIVGVIDPNNVDIGSKEYYRYIGSLTTPPCSENVLWTIINEVKTITMEQLNLLRLAVHDNSKGNSRPTQTLHQRSIELYRPKQVIN